MQGQSRLRQLLTPGPPTAYREGRLLGLLARQDFGDLEFELSSPTSARFTAPSGAPSFSVAERVRKDFLLHTTIAVFSIGRGDVGESQARVRISHTGLMRRRGVSFAAKGGRKASRALAQRLSENEVLKEALLPIDFTSFHIVASSTGWRAELEHFGGSEVTMRFPPTSRYVSLGAKQSRLLLALFGAVERAMRPH